MLLQGPAPSYPAFVPLTSDLQLRGTWSLLNALIFLLPVPVLSTWIPLPGFTFAHSFSSESTIVESFSCSQQTSAPLSCSAQPSSSTRAQNLDLLLVLRWEPDWEGSHVEKQP